jgi:hypothetical protein
MRVLVVIIPFLPKSANHDSIWNKNCEPEFFLPANCSSSGVWACAVVWRTLSLPWGNYKAVPYSGVPRATEPRSVI